MVDKAPPEKLPCTFYFDESAHDRKIRITNGTTLNIWQDGRSRDEYVGSFIGWADSDLFMVEQQYLMFEQNARLIFDKEPNAEVKSQLVRGKHYRHGLASFNKVSVQFYTALFDFLKETDAIWQSVVVSKTELFVRKGLRFCGFNEPGLEDWAAVYSFAKLFRLYANTELLKDMSAYCCGKLQGYQFVRRVVRWLDDIIRYDTGCERKRYELLACERLKEVLLRHKLRLPERDVVFDYDPVGLGLWLCSAEYVHMDENVHIVVDNEEHTAAAIQHWFDDVEQVDSTACFGVRVADLLAGFIARMLQAISVATEQSHADLSNGKASEERVVVPKEWFDLHNRLDIFELYQLIGSVMVGDDLPYYTVLTSCMSDNVIVLFSLLRYMLRFDSFESYSKVSPDEHRDAFDRYSLAELDLYLNDGDERCTFYKEVPVTFTSAKVGRNEPCPCGSGLKYKKCCLRSGRVGKIMLNRPKVPRKPTFDIVNVQEPCVNITCSADDAYRIIANFLGEYRNDGYALSIFDTLSEQIRIVIDCDFSNILTILSFIYNEEHAEPISWVSIDDAKKSYVVGMCLSRGRISGRYMAMGHSLKYLGELE